MIVDVNEQPIEQPKQAYTAGPTSHQSTELTKIISDRRSATAFHRGCKPDFQLFKESQTAISDRITCLAASGYQGLTDLQPIAWANPRPSRESESESDQSEFSPKLYLD